VLYGLLLTGFGFIAFLMGVALLVPVMPVALAYGLLAVLTMGINGASLKLIR
jgi:hypothetical protein